MSSGGILDNQFSLTMAGSTASPGLGFVLAGETVTYTSENDPGVAPSSSSITAVRSPTPDVVERDEDEQCKWTVSATDVPSPREGDTITDDGAQEWGVVRVTPQEGGVFILTCTHSREN